MKVLRSERFDDVYFSAENGLAETRHTFLEGNDLPERWRARRHFTIAETGFGTGLNFLATWLLFDESADDNAALDYISFEKYPLSKAEINAALESWKPELGRYLEQMLARYPLRVGGYHRLILSPRVRLTLIFDDVNEAMPELAVPGGVDAWFLDGFAPAKNPQMWSDTVFSEVKRLSASGAGLATFTAAGAVRRGLENAGFHVEKRPGFGRKRDMITGRLSGAGQSAAVVERPKAVAIIGGGLAGTACAYVLKQNGIESVLFDKEGIAAGASGNTAGIYNPRFSALRGPEAKFYAPAYAQAARTIDDIAAIGEIGAGRTGTLHLINSDEKKKRFDAMRGSWMWHEDHMRLLDAKTAGDLAGVDVPCAGLYLPDSGYVSPRLLCSAYAQGIKTEQREVTDTGAPGNEFDAVILACGAAVRQFDALSWLPVHNVRGQITEISQTGESARMNCNICYGGYVSAPHDGRHIVGSTFQKWLAGTELRDEDDRDNLERLHDNLPAFVAGNITGGRAALRTSSKDRFPVIGRVPDFESWKSGGHNIVPGLYVSTAHGSHGIVSTIMGAHLIADQLTGRPCCLPRESVTQLAPARFLDRARKKGAL